MRIDQVLAGRQVFVTRVNHEKFERQGPYVLSFPPPADCKITARLSQADVNKKLPERLRRDLPASYEQESNSESEARLKSILKLRPQRVIARNINLQGAQLSQANLDYSDLSGADFRGSDLVWACFMGTNLSRANLSGLNLTGITLSYAKLIEADLTDSVLDHASLRYADLTGAKLPSDLSDASLTAAQNLKGLDLYQALELFLSGGEEANSVTFKLPQASTPKSHNHYATVAKDSGGESLTIKYHDNETIVFGPKVDVLYKLYPSGEVSMLENKTVNFERVKSLGFTSEKGEIPSFFSDQIIQSILDTLAQKLSRKPGPTPPAIIYQDRSGQTPKTIRRQIPSQDGLSPEQIEARRILIQGL